MMSWRLWGPDVPSGNAPLLLLHGSHGGWMHWLRNIQALARERCVIVPDMPGFGESDAPRDVHSREDHARAMVEGLHALGIRGPIDVIAFPPDRTSGGSGKGVSVRVDLGGRRIIKKKK